MTNCIEGVLQLPACRGRTVEARFNGGSITSDGGAVLLREADRCLNLTQALAQVIPDKRDARYAQHSLLALLRQRIYGIALGYEDLNDHDTLRHDLCLQTVVDRDHALASSPTLCRLEQTADRAMMVAMSKVLVEQFIASFKTAPKELVLDFDPTDDPVHGHQEGYFYHGYYERYCFLPLYVFCGEHLLVSYLRESRHDPARHTWAILALLVKRFRQVWPDVRIVFRGDSAFCRDPMLTWCEKRGVSYVVGMGKNSRLLSASQGIREQAEADYKEQGAPVQRFANFFYAAGTWHTSRRVIVKAEHTHHGANPRFIVTNLTGDAEAVYKQCYCARGDMENRIKEQQLDLFADRTSCHLWWPNQFRLLLASCAYVLVSAIRRLALQGTELARAQCGTIRRKLFKIGAVVIRNTRRIRFLFSQAYPYQALFQQAVQALRSG